MEDDAVVSSHFEGLGKQRMRWTPELRACFEEAVNQLGGPDRATPKCILKTMSLPGLTIAHIKSYLQKYRMSKFIPESSDEGHLENRNLSEIFPNFSVTSLIQINEALKMHLKEQRPIAQSEIQMQLRAKMDLQSLYMDILAGEKGGFGTNHHVSNEYHSQEHFIIKAGRHGDVVEEEEESNFHQNTRRRSNPAATPSFMAMNSGGGGGDVHASKRPRTAAASGR